MKGVVRQWQYQVPGKCVYGSGSTRKTTGSRRHGNHGRLLADSMGAAKEAVRRVLGVTRLPKGTEVWPE